MIYFVVASYNEAKVIRTTCETLLKQAPNSQIVLVDDSSSDDTEQQLLGLPLFYLKHPINQGQGAALQTGIEFALKQGAQYIVTFDADGQHSALDALSMCEMCKKENLDVVLGSRFLLDETQSLIPEKKQKVLKLAVKFTNLTTGLKLTDTHNGLRVFSRSAAAKIKITQNGMSHASQILSRIAQLKLKYKEHPTTIRYTEYSIAKGQRISNSVNILWDYFVERIRS